MWIQLNSSRAEEFCFARRVVYSAGMAHPFEKMFSEALKVSDQFDNAVLTKAEALLQKGYSGREIAQVLKTYSQGLIDKNEAELVNEAFLEFAHYLED